MDIERIGLALIVLLPFFLVGEAVLAAVGWKMNGWELPRFLNRQWGPGRRGRIAAEFVSVGTWLVLTMVTIWCGLVFSYVAIHLVFFTLGAGAAQVGLIASAVLLVATPIGWGVVIRSHSRAR